MMHKATHDAPLGKSSVLQRVCWHAMTLARTESEATLYLLLQNCSELRPTLLMRSLKSHINVQCSDSPMFW